MNNIWHEGFLSDYASFQSKKIEIGKVDIRHYVSTENMLPNRGGITVAASLPAQEKVTRVEPENVLVSNIRPYFKKIWLSNGTMGCSNDILCFVAKNECLPRYLYYILSSDHFFDYMMTGAKGTKMPRGDKKQIMDYPVSIPHKKLQVRIIGVLSTLERKIENLSQQNHNLDGIAA